MNYTHILYLEKKIENEKDELLDFKVELDTDGDFYSEKEIPNSDSYIVEPLDDSEPFYVTSFASLVANYHKVGIVKIKTWSDYQ